MKLTFSTLIATALVALPAFAFADGASCALAEAGWTVVPGTVPSLEITGSTCEDLHGNLTLTGGPQDTDVLRRAADSSVTHCAFAREFQRGLSTASVGLQRNIMYWFDMPVLGNGIPRMGALAGWTRVTCPYQAKLPTDKCFAVDDFSKAFGSLYHGRFATECAAGAQVTEYAALHEVFGSSLPNYFDPSELFVGSWDDVHQSKSVFFGRNAESEGSSDIQKLAVVGREMLSGAGGGIVSLFPETFLNSKVNRNENFVVVSTSDQGAARLAEKGVRYYNVLLRQIWVLSKSKSPADLEKMNDALNDPFLRDTIIHVHPKGNWPIARHITRLLRVNPRTPYALEFYNSVLHAEVFKRWLKFRTETCNRKEVP